MQRALEIAVVGRCVGADLARRVAIGIAGQEAPRAIEEPARARDAGGLPLDAVLERPHEQLVEPHRIGAVLGAHVVGVDDVVLALRHLIELGLDGRVGTLDEPRGVALLDLVVVVVLATRLAERGLVDHALVEQALERLLGRHQAGIEQHLVPEPRVQEVQHRVLVAADVEVDRHPVLLLLGIPRDVVAIG